MAQVIKIKRGTYSNLPSSGLNPGEPLVTTDRGTIYLATGATTKIPVVPDIAALATVAAIDGDNDLILMHDASATGQKESKITFGSFKSALNIPAASSDEKVAVASGGTAGYLWGTDGADGIMRMGSSMSWAKATESGYVTLNVDVVDGGTF